MTMTVKKQRDVQTPRVIMHKIADIKGGVSIKTSELTEGILTEGTPISKPNNGICNVIKTAEVKEKVADNETQIKISKGSLFNAGDAILITEGGKAVKISEIDRKGKAVDVLTLKEAIGAVEQGAIIAEAKKASQKAALKYEPFAIVGTGLPINAKDNVITDAWIIAVTKGNKLPTFVEEKLKGIINY